MKCIYCGHDSSYRERQAHGQCVCGRRFAFEPKTGDRFTDARFKSAIDAVSANGQIRWGVEHLYYELRRRLRRRTLSWKIFGVMCVALIVQLNLVGLSRLTVVGLLVWLGLWLFLWRLGGSSTVALDQLTFDGLWQRWRTTHGNPPGLIGRKSTKQAFSRPKEDDIGDYSFDRAVICDRARTVDLLLANNFHFENNCAILSIGGYPERPFETVRTMLKRNPKLQVFALHDASIPGCELAYKLATDPSWFKGQVPVTDVGIRPSHAGPFRGLFLPRPHDAVVETGQGISADEERWLNSYVLELAAIRPEQILKRLFRAINRREESSSDSSGSSGGDGSSVWYDSHSFSSDAADSEGGGDSFG